MHYQCVLINAMVCRNQNRNIAVQYAYEEKKNIHIVYTVNSLTKADI